MAFKKMGDSNKNIKQYNEERRIIVDTNKVTADSDLFKGMAYDMYGGDKAASSINSFINTYDKYYKHATGQERFNTNVIDSSTHHELTIFDRATLAQLQPFFKGRFLFVPASMPLMMEKIHPNETERMRIYFQSAVSEVSGWKSRTLEMATVNGLTEANTAEYAQKQIGSTRELTLTFMNLYQGLPQYKYISLWMQYIYSLGSGAAIYPHFTGLEYHEGNHSMTAVYMVVDPSFQIVEEAALIYSMVPKENLANSIMDNVWGNHDVLSYAIPFKVQTIYGNMPQVIRIAQAVLEQVSLQTEYHDLWRHPRGTDPYNNDMGLGGELFNSDGKKAMDKYIEIERSEG